jgi:hypothetical protein
MKWKFRTRHSRERHSHDIVMNYSLAQESVICGVFKVKYDNLGRKTIHNFGMQNVPAFTSCRGEWGYMKRKIFWAKH